MPTVLVVDDSPVDRRLVGGLLSRSPELMVEYAVNGAEAIDRLQWSPPDLIITDLQMPEVDGLALVKHVRSSFPTLPVILITAHGSEQLAFEALQRGAASYVPKSQMGQRLSATVEQVLRLTRDHSYHDLIRRLERFEYEFSLDPDPDLIPPLVDLAQRFLSTVGMCDATETLRVGLALEEAVWNAMFHGCLELTNEAPLGAARSSRDLIERRRHEEAYMGRRICVDVRMAPETATFIVRDEGPGFDMSKRPNLSDENSWDQRGGRGIRLMELFMDEVRFNDRGNEVTLVKKIHSFDFELNAPADAP